MAKYESMVSGMGRLGQYPHLTKPDFGFGDFKQSRGKYKCTLDVNADDPKCIEMMETIDRVQAEHHASALESFKKKGGRGRGPKEAEKPYFDNGDGTVTFKFSSWASFVSRQTNENVQLELPIRDKNGRPFQERPYLTEGSEVKIKFNLVPYGGNAQMDSGVKLQLVLVRVYSIAEFGSNDDWGDDGDDYELSADSYQAPKRPVKQQQQEAIEEPQEDEFDEVDF